MRWLVAGALGLVVMGAFAAPCAGFDQVLEVADPPLVLAGQELEVLEGRLRLSGGACLGNASAELRTSEVVLDPRTGHLQAPAVQGRVGPWTVAAQRLVGAEGALEFAEVRLERGEIRLRAATARAVGEALRLEQLFAETPEVRFSAVRGVLVGDVFRAEGIWATPCVCGEDLRVLGSAAAFDTRTGRLVLTEARMDVYGFTVFRPERLELDPARPLTLSFPFRLAYGRGWTLGVEDFPLPLPGEAFGRWSTSLTLLTEGLGARPLGPEAPGVTTFRFGISARQADRRFAFQLRREEHWAWDGSRTATTVPGAEFTAPGFRFALEPDRAEARIEPRYGIGAATVHPFLRAAREDTRAGLTLGVEARYALRDLVRTDGLTFSLEPWALGAAYPDRADAPGYAALGVNAVLRYTGALEGRLEYRRAYPVGVARFAYEWRGEVERLGFSARRGGFSVTGSASRKWVPDFAVRGLAREDLERTLALGYAGRGWRVEARGTQVERWRPGRAARTALERTYALQLERGWRVEARYLEATGFDPVVTPLRRELQLAYWPAAPGARGGLTLAPSVGYDFLRHGVSRAGVEVAYADCCFVWKVAYQAVLLPQSAGEAVGSRVRFGVELR